MTLSVCCVTRDPGARVAAILGLLRPHADEIVVAADSRASHQDLELYDSAADRLLRFEHDGTGRHLAWLHTQCSGDWILRIDGDEVPSANLLRELSRLREAKDVVQIWIPRRWLYPDAGQWLEGLPWSPDYVGRLVRTLPSLWFRGRLHSGVEPALPARYLESPLYHLDCLVSSLEARRAKARRYTDARPAHLVAGGGGIGTFYLPERLTDPPLAAVPPEDARLIDLVLCGADPAPRPSFEPPPVVSDREIERLFVGRPLDADAYRATIVPLEVDARMQTEECRPLYVRVVNEGSARWPWGLEQPPLIRVAYRWLDLDGTVVVAEGNRSPFPAAVEPGEAVVVPVVVVAPGHAGRFVLEFDLVHEFVRWFDQPARLEVSVLDTAARWAFSIAEAASPQAWREAWRRRFRRSRAVLPTPEVAYLGWTGCGNLGDEAMFLACRQALAPARITAGPHAGLGRGLGPGTGVRVVILGGGTLIGHAEFRETLEQAAAEPATSLYMWAPGVDDPAFRDVDRDNFTAELERWSALLQRFRRVVVRGPRSRELLASYGVDAEVAGDPALLLGENRRPHEETDRILGLNLGIAWQIWGNDPQLLLEQAAELGRSFSRAGWTIRLLPLSSRDVPYLREAARLIGPGADLHDPHGDVDLLLDAIAECRVVIGQKLHAVAFAAALGVPTLALEYHPKCREFHESIGMGEFTLRTDELIVADAAERVLELDAQRDLYRARVTKNVSALRRRLQDNASDIRAALRFASAVIRSR